MDTEHQSAAEQPTHKVRKNPSSEKFESVPVEADGSSTTAKASAPASRALWMDEDEETPSSQVRVAGVNFNIRELRPAEVSALKTRNTQGLADHLGLPLSAITDRDQFLAALRTIPEGAEKWMEFRAGTYTDLCREHVKGWDASRPFKREDIEKLYPSVRAELAQAIIQKSTLGQANADFLEAS